MNESQKSNAQASAKHKNTVSRQRMIVIVDTNQSKRMNVDINKLGSTNAARRQVNRCSWTPIHSTTSDLQIHGTRLKSKICSHQSKQNSTYNFNIFLNKLLSLLLVQNFDNWYEDNQSDANIWQEVCGIDMYIVIHTPHIRPWVLNFPNNMFVNCFLTSNGDNVIEFI